VINENMVQNTTDGVDVSTGIQRKAVNMMNRYIQLLFQIPNKINSTPLPKGRI